MKPSSVAIINPRDLKRLCKDDAGNLENDQRYLDTQKCDIHILYYETFSISPKKLGMTK